MARTTHHVPPESEGKTARPTPSASGDATVPGLPAADLTSKTLGDFQVLRRLGQGGMGQVYLAEQISLKRKVALKILKAELASNPTSLKRFLVEAEMVARATHANIVQIFAIGEENGIHYMALEYVDGFSLRDYLNKKGPPDVSLAMSIMRQATAALSRAAELGIVHRDIKPENILLTRKGEVKVADFGLSRDEQQALNLTQPGVTMGTPLYMSPEQVQGKTVDPRSDIYSFGVTCYHMLSGQPPFRGESAYEVAIHHVQTAPTPLHAIRPDLPAELCALVDKMMAKKAEDRYQTAKEVLRDLNRLREGLSGTVALSTSSPTTDIPAPASSAPVAQPLQRQWRWLPWAMAASLLPALLVGGALAWKTSKASPAASASTDASRKDDSPPLMSEQEKLLRKEVETYADPGDDPVRAVKGLYARIDLGLYLLDQKRWKEAEEFFQTISHDGPSKYKGLGRLGTALVLAFQDKAKESNELFLECTKGLGVHPDKRAVLMRHEQLREMMARALDRNAVNCESAKESFPKELEPLRKPDPELDPPPKPGPFGGPFPRLGPRFKWGDRPPLLPPHKGKDEGGKRKDEK